MVAPEVAVSERYLTVATGKSVLVHFDDPIAAASYAGKTHVLSASRQTADLGVRPAAGAAWIAIAARPWERLGKPVTVTWFPQSADPSPS